MDEGASFESVVVLDQLTDAMHARLFAQSEIAVEKIQLADGFEGVLDRIHAVLKRDGKSSDDDSADVFMSAG